MIDLGKHNILGIRIDAVDYEAAATEIMKSAHSGKPLGVSALAVHGVMTGVMDAEHRYRLNRLNLLLPDGQPVRWALKWLHGTQLPDRVYGPQLMLEICRRAAEEKVSIFLFGSTDSVLHGLEQNLKRRFPLLRIAGSQSSRFRKVTSYEKNKLINKIRRSGAGITFIGLGCPRQEVWVFEHLNALPMPLLAVGAAFDFHAGRMPQAPSSLQTRGLEWLYRLFREPGRLWRRYLFLNPLYLLLILLQRTRHCRFNPDNGKPPVKEQMIG